MGRDVLGEFELMVLLAAMRLGEDEAHALAIVDDIRARAGRSVRRSAVYVTLRRLEEKGLIHSWLGEPRAERGGKARRHVRVEPPGVAAVHESRSAFERMWDGLATDPEQA
ncbi:PadR family transcriptional regulator [Gaopeijia maritima]|uniref:PadR family transcriptional regulator n=1 Tax=Gaopeijia maritima TaxID=3119007 RepID=A0ABU9E7P8_9BACT